MTIFDWVSKTTLAIILILFSSFQQCYAAQADAVDQNTIMGEEADVILDVRKV